MNPYGAPEITAKEAAERAARGRLLLIDVREEEEVVGSLLQIPGILRVPLSRLSEEQEAALGDIQQNYEQSLAVLSDHGVRSAQVTMWLRRKGWHNAVNIRGGAVAWMREVRTGGVAH